MHWFNIYTWKYYIYIGVHNNNNNNNNNSNNNNNGDDDIYF